MGFQIDASGFIIQFVVHAQWRKEGASMRPPQENFECHFQPVWL